MLKHHAPLSMGLNCFVHCIAYVPDLRYYYDVLNILRTLDYSMGEQIDAAQLQPMPDYSSVHQFDYCGVSVYCRKPSSSHLGGTVSFPLLS